MSGSVLSCTICSVNFAENTIFNVKNELAFEGENSLNAESMSAIKIKCNHVFHESCLAQCIAEHKIKTFLPICPTCREPMIKKAVVGGPIAQNLTDGISDDDDFDDFSIIMTIAPAIPVIIALHILRIFTHIE